MKATEREKIDSEEMRAKLRFKTLKLTPSLAQISMSWYEDNFHPIEFLRPLTRDRPWLIRHSPLPKAGSQGMTLALDDWLRSDRRFTHIRWLSEEEWRSKHPGAEFPI